MTRRLSFWIGVLTGVSLAALALATLVGAVVDMIVEGQG